MIHYLGHVMGDNVLCHAEKFTLADTSTFETTAFNDQATVNDGRLGVMTLRRPSKVDSTEMVAH